jgi:hypothetical protein
VTTHTVGELGLAVRKGGVVRVRRVAITQPLCDLQLAVAKTATLKIGGENVVVRAIVRQADGSFIGRVCGVTVGRDGTQPLLANGDTIAFNETHVFSFAD